MRMRSWAWVGVASVLAACSSFNGTDPNTTPGGDGTDSGADGPDAVPGEPADNSFILRPIADQTIVQPSVTKVPVVVKRGKTQLDPITITIEGFPTGVTAAPLVLNGEKGDLELLGTTAAQGDASGKVVAKVGEQTMTTPLKAFVRGAAGALDTRWGTNGQTIVSPATRTLTAADLVLGTSDDVYAVVGGVPPADDPLNNGVIHVDAKGAIDQTYGPGGYAQAYQRQGWARAATLRADGALVVVGGMAGGSTCYDLHAANGTNIHSNCIVGVPGGMMTGSSLGAYAVGVRDDGHIFYGFDNLNGAETDCGIAHYDENANIVTTYANGGAGRATQSVPVALLLGGATDPISYVSLGTNTVVYFRLDSNTGTVLASFPSPKTVSIPGVGRPAVGAQGVLKLAGGNIAVPVNGTAGLYVLELGPDGDPVTSFGTNGLAGPFTIGGSGVATGIAAQADGKLLVVLDTGGLVRFSAAGAIDTTFGTGGIAQTSGGQSVHRKVVVQKTGGRILVSGHAGTPQDVVVSAFWP